MKKTVALALAAAAFIGAVAVSSKDAEARRYHRGFGYGLGIITVGGSGYYEDEQPYYVRNCRYVERYDRWGNYRGTRRICAVVPY